jgi:DNA ligase 1
VFKMIRTFFHRLSHRFFSHPLLHHIRIALVFTPWLFTPWLAAWPLLSHAAPPILLATVWSNETDPSQYLVSEKYDGVRAIWDGSTLKFRSGRMVNAPVWFVAQMPKEKLDGELWLARGEFEKLSGIVRKSTPVDDEWRQIKYMVFELPDAPGTFAERYAALQAIIKQANAPAVRAVEQIRGTTREALRSQLDSIVKAGAEGLMLHQADALYVTGRSDVLIKLKPLEDTEAKVVAYLPGKGKYLGMIGAIRVEMPNGKRFNIGTGFSDEARKNPPPLGSEVTYTYRGMTNSGLPRFPSFLRVREKF